MEYYYVFNILTEDSPGMYRLIEMQYNFVVTLLTEDSPGGDRLIEMHYNSVVTLLTETVLAGTDSRLSQKDTWERMTVMKQGM